jgi:hypothetical protein
MTDQEPSMALIESVIIGGDLGKLQATDRVMYYRAVCESLGLNPLSKPFEYLTLNNKLILYARKDATDQLRALRGISVAITAREFLSDVKLYAVTARATTKDGRTDESIGAVAVGGLQGEALANALMKAETKAKRRATLSIAGLGWLDETELASIPDARTVRVDHATGEIGGPMAAQEAQQPPAHEEPALVAQVRAALEGTPLTMPDVAAFFGGGNQAKVIAAIAVYLAPSPEIPEGRTLQQLVREIADKKSAAQPALV